MKISSIQLIQNISKRYDIEVKDNHNFFANGILVHNCQNIISDLYELITCDPVFEVTIKLDGSSMTGYRHDGYVGVCSRNMDLLETESNTFWRVAREQGIITWLREQERDYAIQGELIGEGVQGNPEKITGQKFYLYDIYDIEAKCYLNHFKRIEIWPFHHVPVIEIQRWANYKNISKEDFIESLLKQADGPSLNHTTNREGIVFKSIDDPAFSFKIISNSFLLKER